MLCPYGENHPISPEHRHIISEQIDVISSRNELGAVYASLEESFTQMFRISLNFRKFIPGSRDKHRVNMLACICAIDRAAFPALMEYWAPEVGVTGVHELLGNALIMDGEKERTQDIRGEDLPNLEPEDGGDKH